VYGKLNANSDEELVRLLQQKDERAFKLIFDRYYRPLTLFAMKYVGEVEEAKEITQELFIRLWSRQSLLDIQFSLKTYLYRGVRNACLNYLETNKVAQQRLQDYRSPERTADNALEHMMAAEQEALLMNAIDNLPEKCRQIFFLSRNEKLSNQAIATRLGVSVKTVEAQITIALKRLRELLISVLWIVMPVFEWASGFEV
jgi:RNA polymerase sigma-70 factor (ECF subfamily)